MTTIRNERLKITTDSMGYKDNKRIKKDSKVNKGIV